MMCLFEALSVLKVVGFAQPSMNWWSFGVGGSFDAELVRPNCK